MSGLRGRTGVAAGVLSALALIAGGLLPAEHVHEARHDAADRPAVVHRHSQPHHEDGDAPHVEHSDDDVVAWLTSSVGITRDPVQPGPAQLLLPNRWPALAARPRSGGVVHDSGTSIHDPPWIHVFTPRGPPVPSV